MILNHMIILDPSRKLEILKSAVASTARLPALNCPSAPYTISLKARKSGSYMPEEIHSQSIHSIFHRTYWAIALDNG